MIRLFLRLLGIKDYEVCQSCETLKEQIKYEREQNRELMNNLLALTKPHIDVIAAEPIAVNPLKQPMTFSKRRVELERQDRENAARIRQSSILIAKPDSATYDNNQVEQLEKELGISQETAKNG